MKLAAKMNDALDKVYVALTLLGDSNVERRKFNGLACLTVWLALFSLVFYGFVDDWVYPIDDVYRAIWPFHTSRARSLSSMNFWLIALFAIASFFIAKNAARRCSERISFRPVTYREGWRRGAIWWVVLMGSMFFGKEKYGVPFVIIGNIWLFFQLASVGEKMLIEDMAQGPEN